MTSPDTLVVFDVDEQQYALPLRVVERVVRAAAVTVVPKAPTLVLGLLNLGGKALPVINTRKWFGLPERPMRLSDQFLITGIGARRVVLLVDRVSGVRIPEDEELITGGEVIPGLESLGGVVQSGRGLTLIQKLDEVNVLAEQADWVPNDQPLEALLSKLAVGRLAKAPPDDPAAPTKKPDAR